MEIGTDYSQIFDPFSQLYFSLTGRCNCTVLFYNYKFLHIRQMCPNATNKLYIIDYGINCELQIIQDFADKHNDVRLHTFHKGSTLYSLIFCLYIRSDVYHNHNVDVYSEVT